MAKAKLILMRHGESEWNFQNLFTGWVDIPLSKRGIEEAFQAGELIRTFQVDLIFMSSLMRAQMSAMIAMTNHSSGKVPVIQHPHEGRLEDWAKIYSEEAASQTIPAFKAWELNERMYGELQGLNKQETIEKYGPEQVKMWRRSYDIRPPGGESLAMTAARSIPYFKGTILPFLKEGKHVLISAHGNSLRSIMMHLDGLSEEEVLGLEVATGKPILYDYEDGKFLKLSLDF